MMSAMNPGENAATNVATNSAGNPTPNPSHPTRIPTQDAVRSVFWSMLWTLLTFGLYMVYWNYWEMRTLNALVGREELSFWRWGVGTVLTFGLFHIYYEYKMSQLILEVQGTYGLERSDYLPWAAVGLSALGFSVVVDAIQQHEINRVYEKAQWSV